MSAAPKFPRPPIRASGPKLAHSEGDPALLAGDRADAATFMRWYERSPHIKKAELIRGVVHLASPVRASAHAEPDSLLQLWLGLYKLGHPELKVYSNATLRLSEDSIVQPDVMLCRLAEGSVKLDADDYLGGAPELVCEIAASSAAVDLQAKKAAYLQAGVREVLVWRTLEQRIDWFVWDLGAYSPLAPDADGVLRGRAFPDLALDVPAALRHDAPALAATLKRAMAPK